MKKWIYELSSSERVNSYKACSCGLCRDFLCGGGYDLGTKFLFIKNYRFNRNVEVAGFVYSLRGRKKAYVSSNMIPQRI